ncbi:MAG: hypothetical protein KGL39_14410 [Patescibacteria group bacterium]|nr:hypothetical protein [Patescibacteria group bacterium]
MIKDVDALKDFLLALVHAPELQPKFDKNGKFLESFCNIAVNRTGQFYNYNQFSGKTADEICGIMAKSSDWQKVSRTDFSLGIQGGKWGVAGMTSSLLNQKSGHVASGFPAPMEMSPSLGHPVPMLANVGIECGIMKESLDFPVNRGEPDYYIFVG